ncbi:MAG: glycosyltransferase family 4 protein [Candidatus Gastranaerophilales bacterium]|nr:glycosyltransferase family 4 protein [Candidatus Gastranaerophilales bacterium]
MKILAIGNYYVPEVTSGIYLVQNLYEGLAQRGVFVELIIPSPSRGIDDKLRKEYYKKEESFYDGKLVIKRIGAPKEPKSSLLRAIRYFLIDFRIFFRALFVNADLIFCESTPPIIGIVAGMLHKIKKAPFVYNLHDVFPDSLVNAGMTTRHSIIYKIGRCVENFVYSNANKIIAVSDGIHENIIQKGVPEEKVLAIYNWIDESSVVHIEREDNILFERFNLSRDNFYVLYAGNIGKAQNIEVIIKAAVRLRKIEKIKFVIVGDGVDKEFYEKQIKEENIDNIYFFPLQPYKDVSYVYSLGNVSIVSCKAGVGQTALPSKTMSIMATQTPIISCYDFNSSLTNLIEKSDCGYCVLPNDDEGLADRIYKLYTDTDEAKKKGVNGYEFLLNNLTKNICVQKYYECLRRVYECCD